MTQDQTLLFGAKYQPDAVSQEEIKNAKLKSSELEKQLKSQVQEADTPPAPSLESEYRGVRSMRFSEKRHATKHIFDRNCLFCGKVRKLLKSKVRDEFYTCQKQNIQHTIEEEAKLLNDTTLLGKISAIRDFIAKETKYHKNCRKEYEYRAKSAIKQNNEKENSAWQKKKIILYFGDVQRMSDLLNGLGLSDTDIDLEKRKRSVLEQKIVMHFGDKIKTFIHPTIGVDGRSFKYKIWRGKEVATRFGTFFGTLNFGVFGTNFFRFGTAIVFFGTATRGGPKYWYYNYIMERPTRSRKQPSRLADYEVSGDSGWVVRGRGRRGGRGLAVPNQLIRPNALTIQGQTGSLTLNELTPEEAAQYLEAAQQHSSRGSIPVMVEEPNIIPTPDDESEDVSEEENERNSVESEREIEEESEQSDIRGSEEENEGNSEKSERESEEENEGNSKKSERESEEESEPSTPPTRSRRRCRRAIGTPSPGRRWEERRRAHNHSAERQSLSRSQSEESNADITKSDLSLGEETLAPVTEGSSQQRKRQRATHMRWKLVFKAGKKLSNILVDRKHRYKFGVWKVLSNGILYRCNHRPQQNPCKCTVLQSGNAIIQRGVHITSCPKQENIYESLVIYRDAKREGLKNKGKSAKAITDPIIAKHFASNRRMKLVNRTQVCKSINKARAKTRPKNPKTLDFSFEDDGIPDGLNLHDVVTAKRRHIVCFTNKQARLLENAKRWTQKDYIRVLKHIKTVILGNSYAMKECVVDFEKSVWLAIEK
ncbi:hypothetical protein OUZ56_017031 [Daphnia magna]|uniref:Uncharacterized protein n=1 Tax=Daphnia magna TaxID=35525 RepID=A0ABR0AS13_9CRUS|nr:hypothetical protein OUZ56_017031 [Daphnia magna]